MLLVLEASIVLWSGGEFALIPFVLLTILQLVASSALLVELFERVSSPPYVRVSP